MGGTCRELCATATAVSGSSPLPYPFPWAMQLYCLIYFFEGGAIKAVYEGKDVFYRLRQEFVLPNSAFL